MLSINRNLVAIALATALAAPMAFAGDNPPADKAAAKATDVVSQKTTDVAGQKTSDAVSQKTTERETGRMKDPTTVTETTVAEPKDPAPGKGNWWADAEEERP